MKTACRPWLFALAVQLAGWPALAQNPPPPAPVPSAAPMPMGVAATVNGQPIQELDVQRALRQVPAAKREEARKEIVSYLIDNLLIDQYLKTVPVQIEAKEIEGRIEEMKAEIKKANRDFAETLKALMLTEEQLRAHIADELRWEKFVGTQATDDRLRDVFARNTDMFNGAMVRARHILLPMGKDAEANNQAKAQLLAFRKQIEEEAARGLTKLPSTADNLAREQERVKLLDTAFAAIAREKSSCPSKAEGGDVSWFPRAGSMVEPFARAAFDLKPFQMSDVVTTQFGHHLILAVDRKPGREVKFEDVKEEVKEVFSFQLRDALKAQLQARAKIVLTPASQP